MKGKKSRGKSSLQKTASSVINIHTHRNSSISDTVPFYNYESVVSIKTNSLKKNRLNCHSFCSQGKKYDQGEDRKRRQRNGQSKDGPRQRNQITNENIKEKGRGPLHLLYSEDIEASRPVLSQQYKRLIELSSEIKMQRSQWQTCVPLNYNVDSGLVDILKRTRTVLNSYRLYSEQLEQDCKRLRHKYNSVVRKMKKYDGK